MMHKHQAHSGRHEVLSVERSFFTAEYQAQACIGMDAGRIVFDTGRHDESPLRSTASGLRSMEGERHRESAASSLGTKTRRRAWSKADNLALDGHDPGAMTCGRFKIDNRQRSSSLAPRLNVSSSE